MDLGGRPGLGTRGGRPGELGLEVGIAGLLGLEVKTTGLGTLGLADLAPESRVGLGGSELEDENMSGLMRSAERLLLRLSSIRRLRAELIWGATGGSEVLGLSFTESESVLLAMSLELLRLGSPLAKPASRLSEDLLSSFLNRSITEGTRARWCELDKRLLGCRFPPSLSS